MDGKQAFHRQLGCKLSFDDQLFWSFHYWYEKEYGKESEFYNIVDVIGWPKDGKITLRFDNDKEKEWTLPLSAMYCKDDQPEATMLWYSNYYDGPLSGLAEYEGKIVWFDCIEWEHDNLFNMRTFGLYEMTDEEIAYAEKRHNSFRKNVEDYAKKYPKRNYTKNKLIIEIDESYMKKET